MLCQIVVEAEAYSSAPGLLRRGLEELLQHLLATFTTILEEQLPGESADLQHLLHHGFAPCVSDTSCVRTANSTPIFFGSTGERLCLQWHWADPFLLSCFVCTFKTIHELRRDMWRIHTHLQTVWSQQASDVCRDQSWGHPPISCGSEVSGRSLLSPGEGAT